MNRIDARFAALAKEAKAAFIPYIAAGDPTLEHTRQLVVAFDKVGADVIELGVPFSDPVADGVVNQEAAQRALKNNVSLADIIKLVGELRDETQVPIVLFSYFNPIFAYGMERLAADASAAGVDGVLCVDLPPEEAGEYETCLAEKGVATVYLLAPTSPPERIELISAHSTGFIYYVSRLGVTGEQASVDSAVKNVVEKIKQHTSKPVVVGFGISNPQHAAEVAGYADGVVVGSAIVRMIGELGENEDMVEKVSAFVSSLVEATKK